MTRANWDKLDHASRLKVLREVSVEQIATDYTSADPDVNAFKTRLRREFALWQPAQAEATAQEAGAPPNKEVVLGAWRDLDRSEALLELIDNSIDAWNRRRTQHPAKAAPQLDIYIDIDADTGQLTYEDNAGGVPTDRLVNLVVPGHSETDPLAPSIGSYKTGGKKAIFRLASAVNITTRFWNPAETGDSAIAVHLDERWLTDVDLYRFPYYALRGNGGLQRGQTRYLMQLRPEPLGACWYTIPSELEKITGDIRRTYGLLIARDGNINIYFPKRGIEITPAIGDLYDFSGAQDGKIDIRPQQVQFDTELEHQGSQHRLTIEIVIGCRVTTATRENIGAGFDLYGNHRLFKYRDERLFYDYLPKGGAANLARGWVNILGPNVFIPWDTHKRHLNYDRDVIEIIRTNPAIKSLFDNWSDAFRQISGLGPGEIKKTIESRYVLSDETSHEIKFVHSARMSVNAAKKRGAKLPSDIFVPSVRAKKPKKDSSVTLNIALTADDARLLAAEFHIKGSLEDARTKRALSEKAKEHLVNLIHPKRAKRS